MKEAGTDNAGPKLIQVSLALDHLLETVADVAKDMRDEGTRMIRETCSALIVGSFLIAFLNLFVKRTPATPGSAFDSPSTQPTRGESPSLANADPILRGD